MSIARADETDLLIPLHNGVHGDAPWHLFLARLKQRLRADDAVVVRRAANERVGDTWLEGLRGGRVYSFEEQVDASGSFGRIVRADADGASAWLSVERASRDFTAANSALLAGLAPHLAVALRTRVALDRAQERAGANREALARAGVAWVAFARDARVIALSDEAAGVVRLAVGDRVAGARSLAAFCLAPREAVAVRVNGAAMLLVPGEGPVPALGLLRTGRIRDDAGLAAVLRELFGLSPSEARFAAAIGAGESIVAAGRAQGLTVETARNYSKRVYAKMRVGGQVALVRAVAEGVADLA